jgi:class 3 adenylate cyclase
MATCPSCGTTNPDEFHFCGACGGSLITHVAPWPEARKIVTVIFCDLVGSTALAERLDPETVREVMERS